MMCPDGQALDPRKACSCMSALDKVSMNRCGNWMEKDAAKIKEKINEAILPQIISLSRPPRPFLIKDPRNVGQVAPLI